MSQAIPVASKPDGTNFMYHAQQLRDDALKHLQTLATQGDLVRVPVGPVSFYLVNHPDLVREVLVTQATKFHKPGNVKAAVQGVMGTNLFASDGDVWRILRRAVSPAFHMKRIQHYTETIAHYAQEMVDGWRGQATVDMPTAMMDLTMGVTTRILFDIDLRDKDAGHAILDFLDAFNERITSNVPVPGWLPVPSNIKMKRNIRTIDEVLLPIIEERRASGEDRGDLLSMLLIAQQQDDSGVLTDHQVRNEVLNLFAAGYEVTAHTTAFTLYLIAQHPLVADRLLYEIDHVLAGQRITMDNLPDLPYLEMVIKESMRLLPVTTMIGRQLVEATTIGAYDLPKNAYVLVAPWTLHRRPDVFPQPDQFLPERFSPSREGEIPKHAYIPFSTGPRICLGNTFAMLQMRVTLATILQQYQLRVPDDYVFEPFWRFNMRPKGGLPLHLTQRERMMA